MIKFSSPALDAYLTEGYHTYIGSRHEKEMHAHKHEVHALLKKSYEKIGGISGSGFKDADDMVKHIPMWKVHKKEGKITAVTMYKDKHGRKGVAAGTDGSEHGKKALGHMMHNDASRKQAWGETSGPALAFRKRQDPDLHKKAIPHDTVKKMFHGEEIRKPPHDDPEVLKHPELKHHFYQRNIGGHWHTKAAFGDPGHKIK